MNKLIFLFVTVIIISCSSEKIPVDLLVKNATIYTVNESFETVEAFVVKDGRIVEVGNSIYLDIKYEATKIFDAGGETIVPGLIDAHAHL